MSDKCLPCLLHERLTENDLDWLISGIEAELEGQEEGLQQSSGGEEDEHFQGNIKDLKELLTKLETARGDSHKPFVTTYQPIAGWKAVLMKWDDECRMHTPWQTGHFAYNTEAEAIADAKAWAQAEEIEYRPRQ